MIKNYLVIAFRNLLRNKLNTIIIVFGLGTGIACSILSFLFIRNELSFDRFHGNIHNIYDVRMLLSLPVGRAVSVPKAHTAKDILDQFPEVRQAVRMERKASVVRFGDRIFEEQAVVTDPSFFDLFTFPLESTTAANPLREPDSIVLSKSMSQKYFGNENPLGRVLSIRLADTFSDFFVTGVMERIPDNSSLEFDLLINLESVYGNSLDSPQAGHSMSCFILLDGKEQAPLLEEKFKTSIDLPLQERFSKESGHVLQPLKEFHLKGEFGSELLSQRSNIRYSFILGSISLLVLLIACFNFMNLAIGKATTRIKEIGVRKVLGARKKQLINQFCLESVMYGFFSLMIGTVITELCLPAFNRLSQKDLRLAVFSNGWTILFLVGLVLLVGLAAGSYPALVLSRFKSVDLFRGKMKLSRKSSFSRSLIVFQFGISIFLIVSTIFLFKQKNFMLKTDLGFDTDRVIVLPVKTLAPEFKKDSTFTANLRSRLLDYEMIQGVSGSGSSFEEGWMATYFQDMEGEPNLVVYNYADEEFMPTLGIDLIQGRNFSEKFPSDLEGSVIVNETFARMLGDEPPIGHRLSEFFQTKFDWTIIGVVKDFHYESLRDPIYPAFIGMRGMDYNYIFIKISGCRIQEAIATIKSEFNHLAPHIPFEYSFLEDDVARQYRREAQWIRMVEYASIFAILIACSGLFGLTLQIIFLRTREIGIRRVLGASVRHVLFLINREFLWLVITANIIAWPCAYLAMSAVLKNYAFRVALSPWVFLVSGLLALLLAVFTVSVHAFQAALDNPAQTLKHE